MGLRRASQASPSFLGIMEAVVIVVRCVMVIMVVVGRRDGHGMVVAKIKEVEELSRNNSTWSRDNVGLWTNLEEFLFTFWLPDYTANTHHANAPTTTMVTMVRHALLFSIFFFTNFFLVYNHYNDDYDHHDHEQPPNRRNQTRQNTSTIHERRWWRLWYVFFLFLSFLPAFFLVCDPFLAFHDHHL